MADLLVIDDEPTIVHALETLLTCSGHRVKTAPNGLSALEQLQTRPLPDLILVDLYMPLMSGSRLVATLRLDPALRTIPVILVTGAVPSPVDFPPDGSYQALIRKPFSVREVLAKVNEVLLGVGR